MKNILTMAITVIILINGNAQDTMEKIMEKRVREFHRVLSLTDKEAYKKFMQENYTKEFLEKPVKLNKVVNDSDGGSVSDSEKPLSNLDAKAGMYQQLHNDFGGVSISSLVTSGNKTELVLKSAGLKGKFTFTFSMDKPYLIETLSVMADVEN